MSAYDFKPEFAALVVSGAKRQTIRRLRAGRSRHAYQGEALQLYTGLRTKACQKLLDPDPVCVAVDPISIIWVDDEVEVLVKNEPLAPFEIEQLAEADGFPDWRKFLEFFMARGLPFHGVIIKWYWAQAPAAKAVTMNTVPGAWPFPERDHQ